MFYLVFAILSIVCTLIILVDAFQSSIVKGVVCLFCGLYYIFYALFEFKHPSKFWIVLGSLLSGGVSGVLYKLGR